VFSGMDALLKLLSAHYPPMEVTVLRGAASLPFMLLPLLVTGGGATCGYGASRCMCCAACSRRGSGRLRLCRAGAVPGQCLCGIPLSPLIVTALSVPLLKERADARNWAAILLGLAGVLTMLRPSASALVTGRARALIAAIAYALSIIRCGC